MLPTALVFWRMQYRSEAKLHSALPWLQQLQCCIQRGELSLSAMSRKKVINTCLHLQVITGADFHPSHCNLFAFSSSKGSIRVADMRSSALCDKSARSYEEAQATVRLIACHVALTIHASMPVCVDAAQAVWNTCMLSARATHISCTRTMHS